MHSARPKQYLDVLGKPLLQHTLEKLLQLPLFTRVVLATDPDDVQVSSIIETIPASQQDLLRLASGGAERAHSVLNALNSLADEAEPDDWVLVHDAVRPCVRLADVEKLVEELQQETAGGLLAMPVRDTIKRSSAEQYVEQTLDRSVLWSAATPQMFRFALLRQALSQGLQEGRELTDESSAIEALGLPVKLVAGHADNIKVTYPEDLVQVEALLLQEQGNRHAAPNTGKTRK